jgi:four helix bundle protein
LTDQVRKASRSVCSNIGEGWRKRRYPQAFVSKLSDADAEAAETCVWLDYARACGFMDEEEHRQLFDTYDHVCAGLCNMMDHPEEWCPGVPSGRATITRNDQ